MSDLLEPVSAAPVATGADRYPGVQPFGDTALDRMRFFGREDEARLLFLQLLSSELLVLFAKPGLGKTSLLNVRICELLRERDFLPLPVRFNQTDVSLTPIDVIAMAIAQTCKIERIDYTPGSRESLWEFLKTAVFWRGERLQTPVFLLDQFEEIFMLQGENFRHEAAGELGELTARRLPERVIRRLQNGQSLPFSDKPPEVKVLIGMREDNLGMLQELTPQIPIILQNRFRLTGLSADDARQAVVKPAALVGSEIQFASRPFAYKEEAIEEIIAAARTKESSIDPFFLQILCSHVEKQVQQKRAGELPQNRLVEVDRTYLGGEPGIKTVAAGFYLDAINRIADSQARERTRELCEEGLLTASGGRRSLLKEDIEASFKVDSRSLDILEKVCLLYKESKHGSFYYEISHDRLASAIYEKRMPRELKIEGEKRKAAEIAANQARRAREEAERFINSFIIELGARLQALGRLDLLEEVQKQVDVYYEQYGRIPQPDESAEMLYRRAVAYETKGDIFFKRHGNLQGALEFYCKRYEIIRELLARDTANADWQRELSVSYDMIGDVLSAQGDLAGALKSYHDSLKICDKLAEQNPANASWQSDLSVSYDKVGDVLSAQGDLPGALKSYRQSLEIRDKLAKHDPANAGWQRNLSVSYNEIGEVLSAQGDLASALKSYRESLEIRDKLAKQDPANAGWQRDLSVSYDRIGYILSAQGDLAGALKSYRDSLEICDKLAKQDPANAGWQRDLSVSYDRIGDMLYAQGDLAGALKNYHDGLNIRDKLAKQDPANMAWQRDLSVTYDRIGDVLYAQGDLASALENYHDGLDIRDNLAKQDPANMGWQRDLSASYDKIGEALSAQIDPTGALDSYRESLEIDYKLAKQDPANRGWQHALSVSYNKVGDLLSAQGDLAGALKSYRESLEIRDELAKQDPANASWQHALSVSYKKVGDVLSAQGDIAGALKSYRENLNIRDRLAEQDPDNLQWKTDLVLSLWRTASIFELQGAPQKSKAIVTYQRALDILRPLAAANRLAAVQKTWISRLETQLKASKSDR